MLARLIELQSNSSSLSLIHTKRIAKENARQSRALKNISQVAKRYLVRAKRVQDDVLNVWGYGKNVKGIKGQIQKEQKET